MKDSTKDDLQYLMLSTLILIMIAIIGAISLFAWSHMTPKEQENILILMFMSNQ